MSPRIHRLGNAVVVMVLITALAPAIAAGAPLNEMEPNDTPATANGPIPADGFVATADTTNDYDYAWLNLNATKQVTLSLTSSPNTCGSNGGYVYVRATDALGRTRLARRSLSTGSEYAWTTPDDPVRLDVEGVYGPNGCKVLFKVAPATGILDGPLPAPPPRTLSLVTPADPTDGVAATATMTGDAFTGDKASVSLAAATGGACPTAPSYSSLSSVGALLKGPFSLAQTVTPASSGNFLLCGWLVSPDSDTPPLGTSRPLVVRTPRATASVATAPTGRITPGKTFQAIVSVQTEGPRNVFLVLNEENARCLANFAANASSDLATVWGTGRVGSSSSGYDSVTRTVGGAAQRLTANVDAPSDSGHYRLCGYVQGTSSSLVPDATFSADVWNGINPPPRRSGTARATILGTALRLPRSGRTAFLPVRCFNVARDRCRVLLVARKNGKTIATIRGVIAGASKSRLRLTVSAQTKRRVRRQGSLNLTITGTSANDAGAIVNVAKKSVKLRPPRR